MEAMFFDKPLDAKQVRALYEATQAARTREQDGTYAAIRASVAREFPPKTQQERA